MNGPGQASETRIVLLTVVVVVAVLRVAQDVFIPLALAILLTFLLAPFVNRLQRWRVNRLFAVMIALVVALTLIGWLGYIAFNQFTDLAHQLPSYQRQLHRNLIHLRGILRSGVEQTSNVVEQLTRELQRVNPAAGQADGAVKVQVVEPPATAFQIVKNFVGPLIRPVATAIVVTVLVAFMLLRLPDLRERVIKLLGARNIRTTTEALNDAAGRVSRYLLIQLLINGWTGLWVSVGLWFLNIPNGGLWGALTLALRFIPYIGVWTAAAMPFALAFAVSEGPERPLMVLGMFMVLEFFNYAVLEPWLYGSRTGVSPVALLLSAAFWAWLWGGVGLFLAIPMTVCLVVMGKYIPSLEFLNVLLGDTPVLEPHQRVYQRLLASNRDEADALLEDALRSKTMVEVCDTAIVPAMRLAAVDYGVGTLKGAKRRTVLEHINMWADERLDLLERASARGAMRAPSKVAGSVMCVPAAAQADHVTAKLLSAALLEQGIGAEVVRPESLDEVLARQAGPEIRAIVVCALPPDAVTPSRVVCKHAQASAPHIPLIVGLWEPGSDLQRARERLESAGARRIVVSFAECVAELARQQMAAADPSAGAPAPRAAMSPT
jgi:predicted PurR-regulated permease PerM